ncbi:hypothetical protein D3C87_1659840 [compost metagenome]
MRNQLIQLFAFVADNVQHRAEDLAFQFVEAFKLDERWHYISATLYFVLIGDSDLVDGTTLITHGLNVFFNTSFGFGVDYRADIYGQALRVAETAFSHCAFQHLDYTVGGIFLQTEYAQRRAALPGAVKS